MTDWCCSVVDPFLARVYISAGRPMGDQASGQPQTCWNVCKGSMQLSPVMLKGELTVCQVQQSPLHPDDIIPAQVHDS